MRKPNAIQVQDFLLVITSQNTLFTLEAEHEPTGKLFTISLDSDSISQVTNGLFENVDKMAQGLKEAAENNFENIRLDITPQGKLIYTIVLSSGVVKKEFGFTLSLVEKEMNPIQIFSRKLNSVKSDIEEWKEAQEIKMQAFETKIESRYEERFDKLENMMIQMEQRMTQRLEKLENLCENLKISVPLKLDIYFNNASERISQFCLTDNDKTATLVSETDSCLEITPQVPSSGRFSYSLKMNSTMDRICFGIISISKTKIIDWHNKESMYGFLLKNGNIGGRVNKGGNGKGPFGNKDSFLNMIVDMDQGTLTFFVDSISINSCSILKSDQYSAFIVLGTAGDSVTLL